MSIRTMSAALSLAVPLLALASAAHAGDPTEVYTKHCAKCHGPDGKAETPAAKAMKAPSLVDAKLADKTPTDVGTTIKVNPKHAAFAGKLTPEELDAAAAKVIEFAKTAQ
jgi:mono/diheme cytochrome c family protein